jgi:tRNA pseudouridine38-40 synthase
MPIRYRPKSKKPLPCFLRRRSSTDAGVHAVKNYFHFDASNLPGNEKLAKAVYNLNAILPGDIIIKKIVPVPDAAHSRFDAIMREYRYYIYQKKNPFLADRAYYFPFTLSLEVLNEVAASVLSYTDFTSFSKRKTQVKTFNCQLYHSSWRQENDTLVYTVSANRFLRGMVRGLVGTMLRAGTGKLDVTAFKNIIEAKDCTLADFSAPPQGLFLTNVVYPDNYFQKKN